MPCHGGQNNALRPGPSLRRFFIQQDRPINRPGREVDEEEGEEIIRGSGSRIPSEGLDAGVEPCQGGYEGQGYVDGEDIWSWCLGEVVCAVGPESKPRQTLKKRESG